MESITIRPIGVIHTGFPEKFGIPRQAGLVETPGYVVLEPPYNDINAVRGLEEFSHIWLIWQVSGALDKVESFSPTVRPPRLGGNTRVGVFASRSPFHPNAMGLSCVKLEHIEISETCGPILHISGADILDGTPLY
ncbi:MAG: tRNA (N6-threonylcarbamoyladenosine(37)-N6)-methyltransferase TrmO, partial [Clostridiales bacterium]|nr:tRNA (N6-threonylcarbamoyladenosine(37)-N6)-methyltransferase TrmO [Candidatus Crickella merdequi]